MTAPKDRRAEFIALMEALAEHAENASDREMLEDAAAEGRDVKAEAERIRGVLAEGLVRAKKQRLLDAGAAHARSVAALEARSTQLPATPAARRALLERTLGRRPETRQLVMITMQHREFEDLTDRDVEGALRQLVALGLIDDASGDE